MALEVKQGLEATDVKYNLWSILLDLNSYLNHYVTKDGISTKKAPSFLLYLRVCAIISSIEHDHSYYGALLFLSGLRLIDSIDEGLTITHVARPLTK